MSNNLYDLLRELETSSVEYFFSDEIIFSNIPLLYSEKNRFFNMSFATLLEFLLLNFFPTIKDQVFINSTKNLNLEIDKKDFLYTKVNTYSLILNEREFTEEENISISYIVKNILKGNVSYENFSDFKKIAEGVYEEGVDSHIENGFIIKISVLYRLVYLIKLFQFYNENDTALLNKNKVEFILKPETIDFLLPLIFMKKAGFPIEIKLYNFTFIDNYNPIYYFFYKGEILKDSCNCFEKNVILTLGYILFRKNLCSEFIKKGDNTTLSKLDKRCLKLYLL